MEEETFEIKRTAVQESEVCSFHDSIYSTNENGGDYVNSLTRTLKTQISLHGNVE